MEVVTSAGRGREGSDAESHSNPFSGATSLWERVGLVPILVLALVVRLGHWWAVRTQPFFAELVMDSQEYDRWARAVAAGDWLGDGVFFQAPLYPYALAVVYRLFGHSYDAVYLLQIALAVAGCWALAETARQLHDQPSSPQARRHGLVTAALAALYAPFVFYDVQLLKESPAICLVGFILLLLVKARRGHRPTSAPWLMTGCLLGLLTLLRENTLLVLPFLLAVTWQREGRARRAAFRSVALLAGLVLVLLPVALRNGLMGGSYLPTTFQGGTNFYIGNHAGADGTYRPIAAGKQIPRLERSEPIRIAEQELGRTLTAAEVSRFWLDRSVDWILAEPGDFAQLQVRKLRLFWRWYEWPDAVDYAWVRDRSPVLWALPVGFGSIVLLACAGVWRRRNLLGRTDGSDLPLAVWIVGWTASTVVFFVFSRYRIPVVPALLPWAAWPLVELWERRVDPRPGARRQSLLWLLVILALVVPRWLEPAPRLDLVHYNLGVLHRDAGRAAAATDAFRRALAAKPDHFLAAMNLGLLAASQQRWTEAESMLRRALEIEPGSDDVRANLGALLLATGRTQEAEAELRRVLAQNPRHPQARGNLDLLLRRGRQAVVKSEP